MSPYELEIVLWYHTRSGDWKDGDFSAPVCHSTLKEFLALGLLEKGTASTSQYVGTDKLNAFVQSLQNTPLPTQAWVDPRDKSVLK